MKMKNFTSYLIILVCILFSASDADSQLKLVSGKKVYLDYTEAGLDSAYTQNFWAPNLQHVITQLRSLIKFSPSKVGDPEHIHYGSTETEQLDLYAPNLKDAPIHIFIHGEVWRSGNGSGNNAYNARKFAESGILYIAPDYQLVNDSIKQNCFKKSLIFLWQINFPC